jgi:hypothetical protein
MSIAIIGCLLTAYREIYKPAAAPFTSKKQHIPYRHDHYYEPTITTNTEIPGLNACIRAASVTFMESNQQESNRHKAAYDAHLMKNYNTQLEHGLNQLMIIAIFAAIGLAIGIYCAWRNPRRTTIKEYYSLMNGLQDLAKAIELPMTNQGTHLIPQYETALHILDDSDHHPDQKDVTSRCVFRYPVKLTLQNGDEITRDLRPLIQEVETFSKFSNQQGLLISPLEVWFVVFNGTMANRIKDRVVHPESDLATSSCLEGAAASGDSRDTNAWKATPPITAEPSPQAISVFSPYNQRHYHPKLQDAFDQHYGLTIVPQ